MTITNLRAGLAALTTATVLLSACTGSGGAEPKTPATSASQAPADNGFATLTADEIMAKVDAAFAAAGSYRIKGEAPADEEGDAATLDFRVSGDDFAGRITIGADAEAELLAVGGKQYVRGNKALVTSILSAEKARTMTAKAGSKWIPVTGKNDLTGMVGIAEIKKELWPEGLPIKGAVTQVDGKPAIIMSDNLSDVQIFVAMTGEPYPLRIVSPGSGEKFTLSEFGAAFPEVTAPAADQIVDPYEQ